MSSNQIKIDEEKIFEKKIENQLLEKNIYSVQTTKTTEIEGIKIKKHVKFTNPVSTTIDVESYKHLNEDVSETRFYHTSENNYQDHAKSTCGCNIF